MILSVAIEVTDKAFLPESYAYLDYFREQGLKCDLVVRGSSDIFNYDAVMLFHGFHPFWKKYPGFIIGEYHSLSTGHYSRFKDFIKRLINVRADFYIYLNENVRKKMWFSKKVNYVTRSMGFNKNDFQDFKNEDKVFDIVYCGSYRNGLLPELKKLADLGLTIAVVGPENNFQHGNITNFGRQSPREARKIITQAKYGLNYTPNIFPFNIQDSTKVIEYCAAGLGVITNKYQWVDEFEKLRGASFLDLDCVINKDQVLGFNFVVPYVDDLNWDDLIKRAGIGSKL